MKTATISRCNIPNHGDPYEYHVIIWYNGIPLPDGRYCHTYEEALQWAEDNNVERVE